MPALPLGLEREPVQVVFAAVRAGGHFLQDAAGDARMQVGSQASVQIAFELHTARGFGEDVRADGTQLGRKFQPGIRTEGQIRCNDQARRVIGRHRKMLGMTVERHASEVAPTGQFVQPIGLTLWGAFGQRHTARLRKHTAQVHRTQHDACAMPACHVEQTLMSQIGPGRDRAHVVGKGFHHDLRYRCPAMQHRAGFRLRFRLGTSACTARCPHHTQNGLSTTSSTTATRSSTGTSLNQRYHTCERAFSPRSKRLIIAPQTW